MKKNFQAEQVREVFPHTSLAAILDDLRETESADLTVENMLEGRFHAVGLFDIFSFFFAVTHCFRTKKSTVEMRATTEHSYTP